MNKSYSIALVLAGLLLAGVTVYGFLGARAKEAEADSLAKLTTAGQQTFRPVRFPSEPCKLVEGMHLKRVCENNGFTIDPDAPPDMWGQRSDDSGIRACLAETFRRELGDHPTDEQILAEARKILVAMEAEGEGFEMLGMWRFLRGQLNPEPDSSSE